MKTHTFFSLVLGFLGLFYAQAWAAQPTTDPRSGLYAPSLSGSYLAGVGALKQKSYKIAADFFRQASAQDPGNKDILSKLFTLEINSGNIDAARPLAQRLLENSDDTFLAHLILAVGEIKDGNFEKAKKNLENLGFYPFDDMMIQLVIAWCTAAQTSNPLEIRLKESMAIVDKKKESRLFSALALLHAPFIADYLKADIRAEEEYKRAYILIPISLETTMAYGSYLRRMGKKKEALKVYNAFLKKDPLNAVILAEREALSRGIRPPPFIATPQEGVAQLFLTLSSVLSTTITFNMGLMYAQLSLYINPNSDTALLNLGQIWEQIKQYEMAIKTYDRISKASPLHEISRIEIAKNLALLGKVDEGISGVEAILATNPHSFDALVTLANLLRSQEKWEEASEVYSRSISALGKKFGKKYWSLLFFRGMAYERLGKWDLAVQDLKKAISYAPNQPALLNYLGYSYIDRGENLKKALKMVKKAVEKAPNDGYIIDSLGWAFYKLGKYKESEEYLKRAVELKPSDPLINDHYGDCLWHLGHELQARYQWMRARDLKPDLKALPLIERKIKEGFLESSPSHPPPIPRSP